MMFLSVDEDMLTLIAEQGGVKLYEFDDSGLFFVEYEGARGGCVRTSLMSYVEAENNFVRRVEEEDYR